MVKNSRKSTKSFDVDPIFNDILHPSRSSATIAADTEDANKNKLNFAANYLTKNYIKQQFKSAKEI